MYPNVGSGGHKLLDPQRGQNDLMIRVDHQVARLKLNMRDPQRISRAGLWAEYDSIRGASNKQLRQALEKHAQREEQRSEQKPI